MNKIILTLLAAGATLVAGAVPARRGIHILPQPDGSTIEVLLCGDEYRHLYMTPDSLPLQRGTDGFMQYAEVDPAAGGLRATGVRATADAALRTGAEKAAIARIDAGAACRVAFSAPLNGGTSRRRAIPQSGLGLFDNTFPVKGDVKALVILVEYADVKFTVADNYFKDLLMKRGFSEYGATGSAYDYFYENSMGQFSPQFDCYGPVTLPQKQAYYGGNNIWGDDNAAEDMVIHAVQLLDDEVDFSQYDTDGDGFVDNVYVFYAGQGEASYGSDDTVWPHAYYIYSGCRKDCRADGVRFDRYACSNELEINTPDGIGTFVHEFSHVMGLPDLYHTETNAKYTPGEWSVMDYGPYNNNGRTPPAYSAYERNALGWNEPVVLDGPESVELEHILYSNKSYLIPTEKDSEFYLFENRQADGWDAYLPYHGMLVWHIDFVENVWQQNAVNNTQNHQYVDIVEAGGTANNSRLTTMKTYPFPGTKNVTSFTASTSPALKSWANKAIDLPVTNIREVDGVIRFDVAGGASDGIADIDAETPECDALAEYYNLQGIRVANPEPGNVYIRRRGAEAVKVMLR